MSSRSPRTVIVLNREQARPLEAGHLDEKPGHRPKVGFPQNNQALWSATGISSGSSLSRRGRGAAS